MQAGIGRKPMGSLAEQMDDVLGRLERAGMQNCPPKLNPVKDANHPQVNSSIRLSSRRHPLSGMNSKIVGLQLSPQGASMPEKKHNERYKAGAVAGGTAGHIATAASGMTAIGIAGKGAGLGAAAGPVGAAAGGVIGLGG